MNFGELKTAIIGRSHRSDLTALIPEFITLAEAEYNRRTNANYAIVGDDDLEGNWLSENAAEVYIFGGLMHLAVYTNDDAGLQKYSALFERALHQAQYAEAKESGELDQAMETDLPISYTSNILQGTP